MIVSLTADALRRAAYPPEELNLDTDTLELALLIRDGFRSRHTSHRKSDIRRMLGQFHRKLRK
jgi:hypothetical protein